MGTCFLWTLVYLVPSYKSITLWEESMCSSIFRTGHSGFHLCKSMLQK